MAKAQFIFTQYKDSFRVHIPNLQKLSVVQIKEIEAFVSARKGLFDFNTFTFVIHKKIEFYEFVSLLEHTDIDATYVEKELVRNTKNHIIKFGQYKGMLYSELPEPYLLWLKSNYQGKDRDIISAELKSRNL